MQAGGTRYILRCLNINFIFTDEEFSQQWQEEIVVLIYKKDDRNGF